MLAQPAPDVETALEQTGEAALEYKLDGARIQVHKSGDEVRIYTRALNDVTASAPEIVDAARALPAHDLILDGEVVSFTPDGRPQPFQVTMRRFGRKLDLDRLRAELPLTPIWFDILYCDGQPLIDHPQSERFAILRGLSPAEHLVPHITTSSVQAAAAFLARVAGKRARRRHGESDRFPLHCRRARTELAQDQKSPYAGPGHSGGGMGQRTAQGMVE